LTSSVVGSITASWTQLPPRAELPRAEATLPLSWMPPPAAGIVSRRHPIGVIFGSIAIGIVSFEKPWPSGWLTRSSSE
jgi:hypothetical protein